MQSLPRSIRAALIIVILSSLRLGAQPDMDLPEPPAFLVHPDWVTTIGGAAYLFPSGIVTEADGSSYISGTVDGTLKIGQKAISSNIPSAYLAKLSPAGTILWLRSAKGQSSGDALARDAAGNLYIAGFFATHTSLPSVVPGADTKLDSGGVFVASYDTSGRLRWVSTVHHRTMSRPSGLAVDRAGNVFMAGDYRPSDSASRSRSDYGVILFKLSPTGQVLWQRNANGPDHDRGHGVAVDSKGNCYLVGSHGRKFAIGDRILSDTVNTGGFVARFNPKGSLDWVISTVGRPMPVPGEVYIKAIGIDAHDKIHLFGMHSPDLYFSGQKKRKKMPDTVFSRSQRNLFLARMDTRGQVEWVRSAYSPKKKEMMPENIAFDRDGNIYICGQAYDGRFESNGPKIEEYAGNGWRVELYYAKYDPKGTLLWLKGARGDGSTNYARAIAVDSAGAVYLHGTFDGVLALRDTAITTNVRMTGFVARLSKAALEAPPLPPASVGSQPIARGPNDLDQTSCECAAVSTRKIGFAPLLKDIATEAEVRKATGFMPVGEKDLTDGLFFMDFQFSNSRTGSAFQSLTLIAYRPIRARIGTGGIVVNLTPCTLKRGQIELPITVSSSQPILAKEPAFDPEQFDRTPRAYYNLVIWLLRIPSEQLLARAMRAFADSLPPRRLIEEANRRYGLNIAIDSGKRGASDSIINDLAWTLDDKKVGVWDIIFDLYIAPIQKDGELAWQADRALGQLFAPWVRSGVKEFVDSRIYRSYRSEIMTKRIGIDFPAELIRRWDFLREQTWRDTAGGERSVSYIFDISELGYRSDRGIELGKITNECLPFAEIAGTGIAFQARAAQLDLDTARNILAIRNDNYPLLMKLVPNPYFRKDPTLGRDSLTPRPIPSLERFTGVYAKEASMRIPFGRGTLDVSCRDMIIGDGVIAGVIDLAGEGTEDAVQIKQRDSVIWITPSELESALAKVMRDGEFKVSKMRRSDGGVTGLRVSFARVLAATKE